MDDGEVVAKIWARCRDAVPEIFELKDRPKITGSGGLNQDWTYRLSRLNERMRFLRYLDGNYFRRLLSHRTRYLISALTLA